MKSKVFLLGIGVVLGMSAYAATLRFRTYIEISNGLEAATNVSSERPEIQTFYENRKNQLPQKGELPEWNEQSTIVATGLGALYCVKMIDKDSKQAVSAQRWTHHLVQFDQAPSQGLLTEEIMNDVLNDYGSLFWQRSVKPDEMTQLKAFTKVVAADFPNEAASTPKILLALCSTFAGTFSANTF